MQEGRNCRDCDQQALDTAQHLWWECPAYDSIRGQTCFTAVVQADRSRWPSCTRVHGVLVKGAPVDATALHRMIGAIYIARHEAERKRQGATPPVHAWMIAASLPAMRHDTTSFTRIPDDPPRWTYGGRIMRALKGWLAALHWTAAGEVSNIELAIDFEIFTGIDVPGPPDGSRIPVNQRGKNLWKMTSAFCRICEDLQLPSPLPAERAERVGCLRTLGAPMVWGGLSLCRHQEQIRNYGHKQSAMPARRRSVLCVLVCAGITVSP